MSLILATGSNLGDKSTHLLKAKEVLSEHFEFISESKIYTSLAIEYTNQPDFYNQVLEFKLPKITPTEAIKLILDIEGKLGRVREIDKGPRTVDIDIIFWGLESIIEKNLTIPHPAWDQRSFVVEPLRELPYFQTIKNHFIIPSTFNNSAKPIN